jgi:hypothetical protein
MQILSIDCTSGHTLFLMKKVLSAGFRAQGLVLNRVDDNNEAEAALELRTERKNSCTFYKPPFEMCTGTFFI